MNVYYVIIFSVVTILISFTSFAQTLGFNYQAIVKADQTQFFEIYGETLGLTVLAESNLSMRFSIIDISVKPERMEYQEEHYTRTNQFGEVNLTIGSGTPLYGSFTDILWDGKKKLMNVEIDYTATGNAYQFSNSQDLLYLPHPTSGFENSLITINSDSIQEIRLDIEQYAMDRKSFDLVLSDSIDFLRDEIDMQMEKMNTVETVLPKIEINSQNIRENGQLIQRLSDLLVNPITGPKGDTGDQGIQGETGATGANGSQGPQGIQGDKGEQGPQGIQGDTGPQGIQGETGAAGANGAQGPQGIQGDKGDKGEQGLQGIQGDTGPQGIQGETGATGADGAQGEKGEQGEKGDSAYEVWNSQEGNGNKTEAEFLASLKGDKGESGAAGATGADGPQGEKGEQGERGDSAYEVWKSQEGNENKTEAEFLALFTDLESGKVFVGDDSNKKAAVYLSGDATLASTGALTISNNAVTTAKINDEAVTNDKLDKTNIPLSGFGAAAEDVALGGMKLTEVANPTEDQDAATKKYVDDQTAADVSVSLAIGEWGTLYPGTVQSTLQDLQGDIASKGNMNTSDYDNDNNNRVDHADNAATVTGFTVGVNVPSNADFTDNQSASEVASTATGTIEATNVDAAIAELESEKLALAGGTMAGPLNIGTSTTNSAALEVNSTTQGFLLPRMTGQERDAISGAVAGLVVWCSNCGGTGEMQLYNGTTWTNMVGDDATPARPTIDDSGYLVFSEPVVYSSIDAFIQQKLENVFDGTNAASTNMDYYFISNLGDNIRIIFDLRTDYTISAFRYINYFNSFLGNSTYGIKNVKVYAVESVEIGGVNITDPVYGQLPDNYSTMFNGEFKEAESALEPFTEEQFDEITVRYIIIDAADTWADSSGMPFGIRSFEVKGVASE